MKKGNKGCGLFSILPLFEKIAIQHFVNDTLNGDIEMYWRNGTLSDKGYCKDGKLDGIYTAYWQNGKKRAERSYRDALLNGIYIWYDKEGKLVGRLELCEWQVGPASYRVAFIDSSRLTVSQLATIAKWTP